jgi:hypothetical protein
MRRFVAALAGMALLAQLEAPAAHAGVNVNRSGDENPMQEVAKSVIYGSVAGLALGGALALASDNNDNDGDLIRYSIVGGTFLGLGMGLWWVTQRPAPSAALELRRGPLDSTAAVEWRASIPVPAVEPRGRPRLTLVRYAF